MKSYQYRKSHCGYKTISRPSYMYLHNEISYTGKTTYVYWIGAQKVNASKEDAVTKAKQKNSHSSQCVSTVHQEGQCEAHSINGVHWCVLLGELYLRSLNSLLGKLCLFLIVIEVQDSTKIMLYNEKKQITKTTKLEQLLRANTMARS